jgi:hypothetical protein
MDVMDVMDIMDGCPVHPSVVERSTISAKVSDFNIKMF